MTQPRTNVRLGIEGDGDAKRRLREVGAVGDRALNQIADASRPASTGLRAVNAASQEGQAALAGYAAQAGPVGSVLTALGPAGLGAAAGIGALVAGMRGAAGAAQEFAGIARAAEELGTSLETLQEVRGLALLGSGADAGAADEGFATFLERISEARQGSGDAADVFQRLGVSVVDATGKLRDGQAVLLDVADGLSRLDSGAERLELRRVLFGDEDGKAFASLDRGRESVERLIAEARDLGLVLDENIIRKGQEVQRELNITARAIDLNLNQALVDLGPLLVAATGFARDLARGLAGIRDRIVDIEDASDNGLEIRLEKTVARLSELREEERKSQEMAERFKGAGISKDSTLFTGPAARARRQEMEELRRLEEEIFTEMERRDAARAARDVEAPSASPLPLPSATGPDPLADTLAERRAAMREMGDILADNETRAEAALLIEKGRVEEAERLLRVREAEAAIDRAVRDAEIAGKAKGLSGAALDNTVEAARARAIAANAERDSQRKLADARRDASQRASDDAAREAKERSDAEAATARLAAAETALADARALAAPAREAQQQAALARDLDSLAVIKDTLAAAQDAARITAAGDRAVATAGPADDVAALREAAEQREREALATRDANAALTERQRILEGEAAARDRLADLERDLSRDRTAAAPVLAALAEAEAAHSVEALDALRERIAAEQDLAQIRAAGDAAAAAAGEFDDPARLRQIAEERAREAIALRDANEALDEREKRLKAMAEAQERLDASNAALTAARAQAAPLRDARGQIEAATNIAELEAIMADIRAAQDAAAILAAGDTAVANAGEFDNLDALRANAEEMERINQLNRDALELQRQKNQLLQDEERTRQQQIKSIEDADRRQIEGFSQRIAQAKSLEDALDGVLRMVLEIAAQGFFEGLFGLGGAGSSGGSLGGFFANIGSSIAGGLAGGGPAPVANANGNAFGAGGIIPFAQGGVVDRPTLFGFGGGRTGLMGEAGPEAILPLRRGADGKLGVAAPQSGGGDTHIHQNINVAADMDEAAWQRRAARLKAEAVQAVADVNSRKLGYLNG